MKQTQSNHNKVSGAIHCSHNDLISLLRLPVGDKIRQYLKHWPRNKLIVVCWTAVQRKLLQFI